MSDLTKSQKVLKTEKRGEMCHISLDGRQFPVNLHILAEIITACMKGCT